jgi:hypothetical protein
MVHVDAATGMVCLNAATVPRVKISKGSTKGATLHHFLLVELQQSAQGGCSNAMPGSESPASSGTFVVQRADELWVEVEPLKALGKGSSAAGSREAQQGDSGGDAPVAGTAGCRVAESRMRVKAIAGEKGVVVMQWQAQQQQLVPVILSAAASARYRPAGEGDSDSDGDDSEAVQQQVQQVALHS